MKVFNVLAAVLEAVQQYIVMFTGMASCLLIAVAAFMRYVLQVDFYGSEELIMLTAFWLYFMGASLATREDSHISADLICSLMKTPRQRRILKTIQHAISLAISVLATNWAYIYIAWSLARNPKTAVLKFPIIWLQFPILVFFILSSLYLLGHVINDIRALVRGGDYGIDPNSRCDDSTRLPSDPQGCGKVEL